MLKSLVDSEEHKALLDTTAVILQDTPWYGELCGFGDNITTLWRYISREWFTNVQISQMVYLLQQSIEHSDVWRNKVEVVDGSFFVKLHSAHPNCVTNPGLYNSQQFRWLKKIGVSFETGAREMFTGIAFIDNNHWVSLSADFSRRKILYGDPKHNDPPEWLIASFRWWISMHTKNEDFVVESLESIRQTDSYSCGILAINALHHHFFPEQTKLLDAMSVDYGRLEQFTNIIGESRSLVGFIFFSLMLHKTHLSSCYYSRTPCIHVYIQAALHSP